MVAVAIQAAQQARAERTQITDDEVLRIGFTGVDVVTKNKGEGEVEYVAKFKVDKATAAGLLMRHLGMLNDKLAVTDRRLDLSKLSNEALDLIARDLGLDEA